STKQSKWYLQYVLSTSAAIHLFFRTLGQEQPKYQVPSLYGFCQWRSVAGTAVIAR
ncbi:hypothetical protein J6590_100421, partial [Homalodisca vitripennis]